MFESKYLPSVPNYGFVNPDVELPIRTVRPRPIQTHDVDWLEGLMAGAAPNIPMPDIVRVHWGAGDRGVVAEMYKVLTDRPSQLVGVSKDTVRHYFDKWGYPHDPNGWTADEAAAAIESHALDLNPLPALMGGQP